MARLIMLGTPNYLLSRPRKSAQDLRLGQKIAGLDRKNSLEQLCETFNTFPGLYEMLPSAEKFAAMNLYKADAWRQPARSHAPTCWLREAVIDGLAKADSRFFLIAGVSRIR
jgi:hypothetical protein